MSSLKKSPISKLLICLSGILLIDYCNYGLFCAAKTERFSYNTLWTFRIIQIRAYRIIWHKNTIAIPKLIFQIGGKSRECVYLRSAIDQHHYFARPTVWINFYLNHPLLSKVISMRSGAKRIIRYCRRCLRLN